MDILGQMRPPMTEQELQQIEEAKEFVRYHSQWFEANALSKVLVILAALEATEQEGKEIDEYCAELVKRCNKIQAELTEYKRKAVQDSCPNCTAVKAETERAEAAEKERDALQSKFNVVDQCAQLLEERATKAEAYAAKLEKAGDFMRGACPIMIARDNWEAARKEKPVA